VKTDKVRTSTVVSYVINAPHVIPPQGGIHAFDCAGCGKKPEIIDQQPGFLASPE
jgi:hypothetical protein